ncbi:TIGR02302 family protein [Albidovulum sp.]|uniref:TIGR02302 family protein n=1 Tax=Albidovulum sp. TaxID=1872424 RepID=UPI0039B97C3C
MTRIKALPHEALRRLAWPVRLTRAGMASERITRGFWPVWTILFALGAALAFGAQDHLPLEAVWIGGVLVLLGLLWALVRGIRRFRWPTEAEALDRLDRTLPGRPISALSDSLALGEGDAGTASVWRAHVARMAERTRAARPPAPDLRVAARDPFALRYAALTAFVMAALFGSLWRVAEAPGLVQPGSAADAAAGPAWEGWAEPPAYTGKPALYLNTVPEGTLDLPEGSRITLRLYGDADAIPVTESLSGRPAAAVPEAEPDTATVRAVEFDAVQSGRLTIGGDGGRGWQVTILPDAPPTVAITGAILREADGTMSQPFTAKDDYAVTAGRAVIELDLAAADRRFGLAAAPEPREPLVYDLPMPITGSRAEFAEALVEDASKHPWANLPVRMTFEVTDGRDQTGRSDTVALPLPGRRFFDPVASALIEMRRDLLWTRDNGARVGQILRALTHRPEGLIRNERAYLMLSVAIRRLDAALAQGPLSAEMRDETAEALWSVAELIEDGGLSNALERMQQAQERLSEAIRNGASPEEIQKLMDALRDATDDYIRKLAENMERKGADEPNQQADAGQQITGDQLQQMMDEIQRLMEEGRMAEAQELLDQLSRMMENLRVTEGQPGENGQRGPGAQAMENLRQTLRDQQGLSDEAFRDMQQQGSQQQGGQQQGGQQPGQGGEGQLGQPDQQDRQPGEGEAQDGQQRRNGDGGQPDAMRPGEGGDPRSLADRQQSLRETLRRQEGALPGDPSDERDAARRSLSEAGRAMEEAERALRQGDTSGAIERQAEAIENLREGMRSLGDALAQNQPQQPGNQGEAVGEAGREAPHDPLGRSTGRSGRIGTDQNLLQGPDVYRRARDILDEIRRRSGEQTRPSEELDYLRRLLGRF